MKASEFINKLQHTKDPWARKPFRLRPWQLDIVDRLFETKRPDGSRQYRTAFIFLPRKNGKSELAAAIALYALLGDGELGAEVYSAAATKEQANLVFNVAAQMCRQDPWLSRAVKIRDSMKRIMHPKSGSFYRSIPADAPNQHGLNASCVVYDELHAAPDGELFDVLSTCQGAREQPLFVTITTAGWDRSSVCYRQYDYAKRVLRGDVEDPTFLPVIYEADQSDDWTDRDVWAKANPALGDFRKVEEMETMFARAQSIPEAENSFRRLYLNQWTTQEVRWIPMSAWSACGTVERSEIAARQRGRSCFAGLDLSATTDLSALVLVFPTDDGTFEVLPYFWVPSEKIMERVHKDKVPYDSWVKRGFVDTVPGSVMEYAPIREKIDQLNEIYHIQEIAVDPWQAQETMTELERSGYKVFKFQQSIRNFNSPSKLLSRLIASQKIEHAGNPVLSWHANNVALDQDYAERIGPSKKKSTEKIDGIVALIMALGRHQVSGEAGSVYDGRGALIL